jgi:hypothetical protein
MQISQKYREQKLSETAGNVITNVSNNYGEVAKMGNMITQFGFEMEETRLQAEYRDQLSSARLEVAKKFDEFQNSLTPDNTSEYESKLENLHSKFGEIKLTNGKAKGDFDL